MPNFRQTPASTRRTARPAEPSIALNFEEQAPALSSSFGLIEVDAPPSSIVTISDGRAFTNSRDVAEFFGKQHQHVVRDIERLIADAPEVSSNFGQVSVPAAAKVGPRSLRAFTMDKDGFTLLAMGFTGPKALAFKRHRAELERHGVIATVAKTSGPKGGCPGRECRPSAMRPNWSGTAHCIRLMRCRSCPPRTEKARQRTAGPRLEQLSTGGPMPTAAPGCAARGCRHR
ncbi:MAG: Rha family transcriptional regulator [Novosphingobium sp.]|nr:Rha family transcriptional regulator [Novosphingobium sp.]